MAKTLVYLRKLKRFGLRMIVRAKWITFPFFDGVPLYDVSLFFWKSITKGAISTRASGIAFSFFLALFPTIIFLFTLIPYSNFQNDLYLIIQEIVPDSVFEWISETIDGILHEKRGDLLSLGFFMALFFATNGFAAMMAAFDASIHSHTSRTWLKQRLISFLLLIILSILLLATIALLTGGQWLINYLLENHILEDRFTYYILTVGRWIIIIALFFFAYSFLYYMAPAKKTRWRFISAGGTMATTLSILIFVGFGYYINNFSQYNKLYGSIGTLLIVLLLIYLLSFVLLLGFELNASIREAKEKNKRLRV